MTSIFKAGLLAAIITSPGVYAAEKAVTETRDLASFTEIDVDGSFDVFVTVGPAQSVKVTADADIIDRVVTEVDGDELTIKMKRGSYNNIRELRVDITVPSLTEAAMNGSGDIEVDGAKGDSFELSVNGSGDATLMNAMVGKVGLSVNGSGDVDASGTCTEVEAEVNGSGDVDASGLKCEIAVADGSGSGDIRVHATKEVKASMSGSGDITITGAPAKVKTSVNGSGDVSVE